MPPFEDDCGWHYLNLMILEQVPQYEKKGINTEVLMPQSVDKVSFQKPVLLKCTKLRFRKAFLREEGGPLAVEGACD